MRIVTDTAFTPHTIPPFTHPRLVGHSPFGGLDLGAMVAAILNKEAPFPKHVSAEARSLVEGLLRKKAEERLAWDTSKVAS